MALVTAAVCASVIPALVDQPCSPGLDAWLRVTDAQSVREDLWAMALDDACVRAAYERWLQGHERLGGPKVPESPSPPPPRGQP